jgi:hypothetical protein
MGEAERRGVQLTVADSAGGSYLLQAAPSGYVQWSRGGYQGPIGWIVHEVGTKVVNRVIFRGAWTVTVWKGDHIAPKRAKVIKRRFPTDTAAITAVHEVEATIKASGRPGSSPGPS